MSTVTKYPYCNPEIWGGVECTINRVNDRYRDQLRMTGHYHRSGDIELFAQLGMVRLRYPVLWELHEPSEGHMIDWTWATSQMETIRANNIIPIIGLLHHGSGPVFTDLLDDQFPFKLASYARKFASEFPLISEYTPINEPLTTARFSGLYGHWYPHQQCERRFFEMLLNQLKAVILAMQAIAEINPAAKLIQTEDLARTHSTPLLTYQAEFENERRWLTYDILSGKFDKNHYFWDYFIKLGIPLKKLQFFIDNKFPPSILGLNYYVTSERYLDEQIAKYPRCCAGGNGRHQYVDTEAVWTGHCQGPLSLIKEVWQRYQLPLAITECHLGCTREEQMRWLKEIWDSCCQLKKESVDIRAVTAWSLLGAYDWNSLLTRESNHYEPGVFDTRNNCMRPTSLARMIKAFSTGGDFNHPLLGTPGWWRRNAPVCSDSDRSDSRTSNIRPLLIIGKTGTLGQAFAKICESRGIKFVAVGRAEMDINSSQSVRACIDQHRPWAIINAAGYVKVDEAEEHPDECYAVNVKFPAMLADICRQAGIRMMSFSSDLVFNGHKRAPYFESDDVFPLSVYGSSKAEAERLILAHNPQAMVVRTSAFFGPWDQYNFVYNVLDSLRNHRNLLLPDDVTVSPTYVPDLCQFSLDLFIDEEEGIWHLSNDCMASWYSLGCMIAERIKCEDSCLIAKPLAEMDWKASRPLYSVLQSNKGVELPGFENALSRYFEQCMI